MKYLVIISMFIGLGYAQSSHKNLSVELLKDLHGAIADSISIPVEHLNLQFSEDSKAEKFLNDCLPQVSSSVEIGNMQDIKVTATHVELTINRADTKSDRNSRYLRQLELSVVFVHNQQAYGWQGRISDQLSKTQLKSLLKDDFPIMVGGDYSKDEPKLATILLTTLGVFSLGAALFFIRT